MCHCIPYFITETKYEMDLDMVGNKMPVLLNYKGFIVHFTCLGRSMGCNSW